MMKRSVAITTLKQVNLFFYVAGMRAYEINSVLMKVDRAILSWIENKNCNKSHSMITAW